MAYPTITYDATSGSNRSPYDQSGSGIGAWSGTVLTLSSTVDFTSGSYPVSADDGSNYVWVSGATNNRRLAQIAASGFNPSTSACTSITTVQAASVATYSTSYHVNGSRQSMDDDVGEADPEWWFPGWIIEFSREDHPIWIFRPANDAGWSSSTLHDPALTLRPVASGTGRPNIIVTQTGQLMGIQSYASIIASGLTFTASGGVNTYIGYGSSSQLHMEDCIIDGNGIANYCVFQSGTYSQSLFKNCYFKGAILGGVHAIATRMGITIQSCVFDGQGNTDFQYSCIRIGGNAAKAFVYNCLLFDSYNAGIMFNEDLQYSMLTVEGCTITNNDGDGINTSTDAGGYPSTYNVHNNIVYGNGLFGIVGNSVNSRYVWNCDGNAVYGNTSGNYEGNPTPGPNAITLTGDPFTRDAENPYTLNNTAGGGAECRNAAYPSTLNVSGI